MAYTTVNKSTSHFNTKLYDGTGSTQSITGVGFQPDWTWIKYRGGTGGHNLFDSVRGATKRIRTNSTATEATGADTLTGFISDGFSLGADTTGDGVNISGYSNVSWNWKAGGASSSNSDGDITSTVSANTTAGFSIVKWNGSNYTSSSTIGHGLGAVPKLIIIKNLDNADDWYVYASEVGAGGYLKLNSVAVATSSTGWMNSSTAPTNQVFTQTSTFWGTSNYDYIAYCFAEVPGFSKFGKYTANDSDYPGSPFVYTGFKPQFIMFKNISDANAACDWTITDNKRRLYNPTNKKLYANEDLGDQSDEICNLLSNGFKLDNSTEDLNYSTKSYLYFAFGQSIVGTNNVPCTGW
tara:strand:- start:233 stop:1288 length:1056 start_codon:yes stop_codon:yes gene_type:complete